MKKIILSLLVILAAFTTYAQAPKYLLSSHILDISTGLPAPGVNVKLEKLDKKSNVWKMIDEKKTDKNGRIPDFLEENKSEKGIYKLTFLVPTTSNLKKQKAFIHL